MNLRRLASRQYHSLRLYSSKIPISGNKKIPELPDTKQSPIKPNQKIKQDPPAGKETAPATQNIELQSWSPPKAISSSIGTVFGATQSFVSSITPLDVSANLDKQFQLTSSPALLYRESTHKLINAVETDIQTDNGGRTIILGNHY